MKIYALIQSDVWRTKSSYQFLGFFSTIEKAHKYAKENNLFSCKWEIFWEEYTVDCPS
ncbi:hypothetical protein [Chryseobacterium taklimakanense]|uniref:hypothetical protein n=1 Tax=Chryseobacterium taklimakanense TaxID=536441 RepID=UPI0013DDC06F|nr:hypothetical protein [Chryseobacterium taklimakanense]